MYIQCNEVPICKLLFPIFIKPFPGRHGIAGAIRHAFFTCGRDHLDIAAAPRAHLGRGFEFVP
jgi:hypothetical protein